MSRRTRTNEGVHSGYTFITMLSLYFIPITGMVFVLRALYDICKALIDFSLELIDSAPPLVGDNKRRQDK